MKSLLSILCLVLSFTIFAQTKTLKTSTTYKFLTNISVKESVYSVDVTFPETNFKLKICNLANSCHITLAYGFDVEKELFLKSMLDLFKTKIDSTIVLSDFSADVIKGLPLKAKKAFAATKTEIQQITDAIDNPDREYSGKLKINKKVPILLTNTSGKKLLNKAGLKKLKDSNRNYLEHITIKKAYLNFFNNKASTIVIEGDVFNNCSEKIIENLIVSNRSFSIPIRYFNTPGNRLSFMYKNEKFVLEIDDLFDYNSDDHFNYSLANKEMVLTAEEPIKRVEQRRFIDYFTGIFYTDLMGFDGANTNSLINAQARLLLPLNQRNISPNWDSNFGISYGKYSIFRQMTTTLNLGLYDNSDEDFRLVKSTDGSEIELSDIFRKKNMNGNIGLDVLSYEAKGFSTTISAGYQASFYRTKFKSVITKTDSLATGANPDVVKTGQLFSIAHGPYLNFEIRPQTNFGADLRIALDHFTFNGTNEVAGVDIDQLLLNTGRNHALFKHNIINIKADFYWIAKNAKANGGVYASIGGSYFTEGSIIEPQILVGYATNLTSFVNRFKKEKKAVPAK